MNHKQILDKVDEKIKKINDYKFEAKDELEYFGQFFDNNSISLEKLGDIEIDKFLRISVSFLINELSFEEVEFFSDYLENICKKIELDYKNDFVNLEEPNIIYVVKSLDILNDNEKLNKAIFYLNKKDFKKLDELTIDLLDNDLRVKFIDIVKRIEETSPKQIDSIIPLFKIYKKKPELIIPLCIVHFILLSKKSKEYYERCITQVEIESGIKVREKEKQKKYKEAMRGYFSRYSYLFDGINKTYGSYYSKLLSTFKSEKRRNRKDIKNYQDFKNLFSLAIKKDEIINYKELIKLLEDEKLKVEVLKYIYNHNERYYKKLAKKLEFLQSNSKTRFLVLLKENNIQNYNIDKIMKKPYDEVEEIMNVVKQFTCDNVLIIKILEDSDLKTVKKIKSYIDKGIVKLKTIEIWPDIFISNSPEYKTLVNNIEILQDANYNIVNFTNFDIVLSDSNLLNENITIIENYDLVHYIKGENDYKFMSYDNLDKRIDMFIELGYEKYLKKDITILNENNLERLYILKILGSQLNSIEEIRKILTNNDFFIPDDKIYDYIENHTIYYLDEDIDVDLSCYQYTNLSYKIDDIILSKIRVDNNIKKGKNLFRSLIEGCILNESEIERLKRELKGKSKINK